jgi:hypothetical protein
MRKKQASVCFVHYRKVNIALLLHHSLAGAKKTWPVAFTGCCGINTLTMATVDFQVNRAQETRPTWTLESQ